MLGHNKIITDEDMHNVAEFCRTLGQDYAKICEAAKRAKYMKEIGLKKLALTSGAKSWAEKEANAMITPEYEALADAHVKADTALEAMELKFKAYETLRAIWQTQSANERG